MGTGKVGRHWLAALSVVVLLTLTSVTVLFVANSILTTQVNGGETPAAPEVAGTTVTFGALGDWSSDKPGYPISIAEMKRLVARGGTFVLAVGDLGYQPGDEANWCSKIKSVVNQTLVVAGNHDTGQNTGGLIANYVQYCPFNMAVPITTGPTYGYGVTYYFDYPATNPLVRVIMVSAGLAGTVSGQNYNSGGAEYTWTINAVTQAKAAGIPWVVVGTHKLCINPGSYGCEIGQAFWDALIDSGADLLLTGHYHIYARSYQLAHSASCTSVSGSSYNAACVADFDADMVKGAGLVQVTDGAGGTSVYSIDTTNDGQYFPAYMGSNMNSQGKSSGWGPAIIRLNATTLEGSTTFCPSGSTDSAGECSGAASTTFQDSFTISSGSPPPPPALSASFSFSPSNPIVGQSVTFTGSASGGTSPYTYAWAFGDGATGTGATATHAYATAATYTATLTVTDAATKTASASKSVVVGAAPPPLAASFTFTPGSPTVGQTVTFTGSASGGTSPYSYAWTFGDGGTGTGASATHAYSSAATFTATLTVTDSASHTASSSKSVVVSAALSPSFTFTPSNPTVGQSVAFTGSASGGTSPYTYAWTFGDGATGTGSTASHAYTTGTTFTATLTVTDSASHSASTSKSVVVSAAMAPSFTFSPSNPLVGQSVSFTGSATGGTSPYTYAWTFGDGATGSGATTAHTYASAATFTASLTVTDAAAHTASASKSIIVTAPPPSGGNPTASFTFSPTWPRANAAVSFDASASSSPNASATLEVRWDWTNDGTFDTAWSSTRTATHAYTTAATYTARLQVRDNGGRTDNTTRSVPVDGTVPSTSASVSGTLGNAGWYKSAATVTLTAADDLSGVAATYFRRDNGSWTQGTTASVTGDGPHSVDFYSVDRAGNTEGTRTIFVSVDTTPPATTATFEGVKDVNGSYVSSVNVTLTATDVASGVAATKYRVDHGAWTPYVSTFIVTGSGTHLVEYNSTDVAGDAEATKSAAPTIASYVPPSSQPPVSTLSLAGTMGPDGWYVSAVTVTLSATSPSSLAVTIDYRLDGGTWRAYASSFVLADGRHTLEYNATDSALNEEATRTASVLVDTGMPSTAANLTGTHGRDHWWTSAVSVTLTATDAVSGVASTAYRVDGGAWQAYASKFSVSNGRHLLEYRSTDAAGLTETIASVGIKVDSSPPKVTMSGSTLTLTSSSATLSWIETDDVAGVIENGVSVDSGPYVSVGLNLTTTLSLADGNHLVRVRAMDDAGNVGVAEVSVRVDTNPFSPSGPYQGVPLYLLLEAVIALLVVLVLRRRSRAKRARRQQALRRMHARTR